MQNTPLDIVCSRIPRPILCQVRAEPTLADAVRTVTVYCDERLTETRIRGRMFASGVDSCVRDGDLVAFSPSKTDLPDTSLLVVVRTSPPGGRKWYAIIDQVVCNAVMLLGAYPWR